MNGELTPYAVSLQRVLSAHGIDLGFGELCGMLRTDRSLDAARRVLEEHGKIARVVQVDADELDELRLPTLITFSDELPCLLRDVSRRRVTLERGHAVFELSRASVAGALTGALEIDHAPAVQGHFVRRLARAMTTRNRALLGLFALSLLLAAIGTVGPKLTQTLIDDALPDHAGSTLKLIVWTMLAVAVQRAAIGAVRDRVIRGFQAGLSRELTRDAVARILARPLAEIWPSQDPKFED